MTANSDVRRAFAKLAQRPDNEIDLLQGALLIAQEEYPGLDASAVNDRVDFLAQCVRLELGQPAGIVVNDADEAAEPFAGRAARRDVIAAINRVLFAANGFHGNTAQYEDPRNSFINEVLDRKTGLPITLSLLYIEVARRAGHTLVGIGMPGHFIVGFPPVPVVADHYDGKMIFIDPFNQGAVLSKADCRAHFHHLYGPEYPFSREVLAPITKHQLLTRMLTNLKHIYLQQGDFRRALAVVERLLLLQPAAVWELKLRGLLYFRLGKFTQARADLRRYLGDVPAGEDSGLLQYYVEFSQRMIVATN